MAEIKGDYDPKFENLKALLEKNLAAGDELGAAIVVNIDGKEAVNIWGGYADEEHTRQWDQDTIVNVWSSSKTISTFAALLLIDRGLISANDKVSKYWPEFAANGKEDVEIRHLLSHTSGVSGWDLPITGEDICDVEKSTAKLAEQAPWWEPGTASGYHSLSMGHLIGGVVKRVTGKSLKQFIAEEVAAPVDADFQLGALEKDWPRIANLVQPPPLELGQLEPGTVAFKTWTGPAFLSAYIAHQPIWRNAEIGAANGHGTALGLNRILSAIPLGGVVNGKKIISQETIDLIFTPQSNGIDLAMGIPVSFGIGYAIAVEKPPVQWIPKGRICFWGGWGGSIQILDLDRRMTISYVMNKMGAGLMGTDRTEAYVKAVYAALGVTL